MSEAHDYSQPNGHDLLTLNGFPAASGRDYVSPKKIEGIYRRLLSGEVMYQHEASEKFNCKSLASIVSRLRKGGHDIITERSRGDLDRGYRLVVPTDPVMVTPEPETQGATVEIQPSAGSAMPLDSIADIGTLTVRIGEAGLEIQINTAGTTTPASFHRLGRNHIRYLLANLQAFAAE